MTTHTKQRPTDGRPASPEKPDIREKGAAIDGTPQILDRRLFMQIQAFGGCVDPKSLIASLEKWGHECVLYSDVNDPQGMAILTFSEDENHFVGPVRNLLTSEPFVSLTQKHEYTMLGRTYSIGYERELKDWLLDKPRRRVLDSAWPWAVWYPLRRKGTFQQLPKDEQKQVLGEHGTIGRSYGEAGLALDVRLACFGLDKNDNDFVIGLLGKKLHPLSAVIERMRKTKQTSSLMEKMGPFFVGRVLWQSKLR